MHLTVPADVAMDWAVHAGARVFWEKGDLMPGDPVRCKGCNRDDAKSRCLKDIADYARENDEEVRSHPCYWLTHFA